MNLLAGGKKMPYHYLTFWLVSIVERLVKAKSDGSLSNSLGENSAIMSRLKSKSLEPLTGTLAYVLIFGIGVKCNAWLLLENDVFNWSIM